MGLFDLGDFTPRVDVSPTKLAVIQSESESEYYGVPLDATRDILNLEKLEGSILDPCAGQGHIITVLKEFYPDNEIVGTDYIERPNDFNIQYGIDFFSYDYKRKFDCIIMNPLYSIAKEYVERALMLANKRVMVFMKLTFLEGVNRKDFLMQSPLHYVYVFSRRVSPLKNGSLTNEQGKDWHSTFCFAWFIWDKDYDGEPIIRWI